VRLLLGAVLAVGLLAGGCAIENEIFTARIVNDTPSTVTVVQCADSCAPDNWSERDRLAPGQSTLANDTPGVNQAWLVVAGSHVRGCLTLYEPAGFAGPEASFRVSRSFPLSECGINVVIRRN